MQRLTVLATAATLLATPVLADGHITGDAEAGERAFRQCISCHVVVDAEGETLAGRNARTGPNLWGIDGRMIGSVEDFRYSPGLTALMEAEMVWDEASFADYVQDPTGYIREAAEDDSLRGAMSFRVRSEEDALNLYAYLASLGGPEAE
ncbi:c-type cytochrome [Rhodobacteraceae bacterium N5(2021)]|uniref:C-type cytochrome n=1 Tax=Gymnodinialimonas phycosphaerae TaxID=2841589 RepID=A0A975TUA8_9RHOB|nr:c-type cytochrome [Gymnodinialimonas phycosphaerae]MBY4894220.1 c-type cytochrome [Gymnodinialimonas phycosphaerae]